MPRDEQAIRERHFVEEFGLIFEEMGSPRMMGKIVGMLLICDPPHQSSQQIAEYLDASRGSISTLTRQLIQTNMLQKVPVQGSRATYFRMVSDGWTEIMRAQLAYLRILTNIADQGLELLQDAPPARRTRLEHFKSFYEHIEREFQPMIDRWGAEHPEEEP